MNRWLLTVTVAAILASGLASAHDVWLQTNTNLIRTGDAIHIDLMLGNHGNDHRDFKLAGKLSPEQMDTFLVVDPDGKKYDMKPNLTDLGYAPKEGYSSVKFTTGKAGLYLAAFTSDRVVNHGKPVRGYRSAKTYFGVSDSLDRVGKNLTGFDRPLGHKIELVPVANPIAPMGPGIPIQVKLLFEGKPLSGAKVCFIPRGHSQGGRRPRIRTDDRRTGQGVVHTQDGHLLPRRRSLPPRRKRRRLRFDALHRFADRVCAREVPLLRRLMLFPTKN